MRPDFVAVDEDVPGDAVTAPGVELCKRARNRDRSRQRTHPTTNRPLVGGRTATTRVDRVWMASGLPKLGPIRALLLKPRGPEPVRLVRGWIKLTHLR